MDQHNQESCPGTCISTVNVSVHLEKTRCTYFQALQEQFHATVVKEHLTVIRGLISNVPEGAPGELHHLIALWSRRERERKICKCGSPVQTSHLWFISAIAPDEFRGKKILLFVFSLSASVLVCFITFASLPYSLLPCHPPSSDKKFCSTSWDVSCLVEKLGQRSRLISMPKSD